MPDETTSTMAFEWFLPPWAVALVGAGLIGLSWWLAGRDATSTSRRKLVWILFALRAVAVGILLWMLAGPTLVTHVRQVRKKSVAVVVDASASMGMVESPDGSGNVTRWDAAAGGGGANGSIAELDRGVGALRAAENQMSAFARLPDATAAGDARSMLTRAVKSLEAGADVIAAWSGDAAGAAGDSKRVVAEIAGSIRDQVVGPVRENGSGLGRGRSLASLERETWLPDRLTILSTLVTRVERLADERSQGVDRAVAGAAGDGRPPAGTRSRLAKVEAFLGAAEDGWLGEIREKAAVMRYEFGDKVVPMGGARWGAADEARTSPLATATQLGAALQQLALESSERPLDAAILITDGGHNAGRDPRELASSFSGIPLHIVPIGNTRMQRDVILHHTHAPKAVFENDTVVVDAIVTAYDCENESLQVELVEGETVVDRKVLEANAAVFDSRVELRWKATKLGRHSFALRVGPVDRERTAENNTSKVEIQVMEDRIRVLVADNLPRWETRYLLNLFKRDDRIEFDQLLFEPQRLSGPGVRPSFPATIEEWAKYRVVILGDVLPGQLTPALQEMVKRYVTEAGGNLIVVAGRESMPEAFASQSLASILPVEVAGRAGGRETAFFLHVTHEGSMALATQIAENPGESERIWREMSERMPIYSLSASSRLKPTAHSLIRASRDRAGADATAAGNQSFLAWHYVGAGRVVFLAAPVSYQLRYREGDRFHHRFWGQLLRWAVARDMAVGSQTSRISTDKLVYEEGEPVEVTLRLNQLDGTAVTGALSHVVASAGGQPVQELAFVEDETRPGSYRAVLRHLPAGPVHLQATGDRIDALLASEDFRRPVETSITIDPSGIQELRHPLCNLPLLREIAQAGGGVVLPPTALEAAMRQVDFDPEVLEHLSKKPLWNRLDLFLVFILCLSLEWAGRKFLGFS